MKFLILFTALSFFGFLTPFFVSFSEAQSGISVTPVLQEIALDGALETNKSFTVFVTNHTDAVTTLRLSTIDFGSLDESGGVAFLGASSDLEEKYSLASFIRLEKDAIALLPGETQEVKVTIENRESLSPGGHYAALIFHTGNSQSDVSTSNHVAIQQMFSVLVLVKKFGGEIYQLELKDHAYWHRPWTLSGSVELRFQNTGNIHVVPRGRINVTDPLGRIVAKGIINQESGIVLPETFRTMKTQLLSVELAWLPGRYTFMLAHRYDGRDDVTVTTETFWHVPMSSIIGLALIFVTIMFLVSFYVKKKKNA